MNSEDAKATDKIFFVTGSPGAHEPFAVYSFWLTREEAEADAARMTEANKKRGFGYENYEVGEAPIGKPGVLDEYFN